MVFAKLAWFGRTALEVFTSEFKYRTTEYYRHALEAGVITVNGRVVGPDHIMEYDDRIDQVFHGHEPPVTAKPIKILLYDTERQLLVVEKPAGIPTHRSGRFQRNSVIEILKNEHGFRDIYGVHRLDMAVSGVLLLPLSLGLSHTLAKEFKTRSVSKEYVARCLGKFPENETVCNAPLLHIDSRIGLHVVHPDGKHAETTFTRLRYDPDTDTSIVLCKPSTGRGHQIRVHLHHLSHPIANDPVYNIDANIFREEIAKIRSQSEVEIPDPDAPPNSSNTSHHPTKPSDSALAPADQADASIESTTPESPLKTSTLQSSSTEDWSRWRNVVFISRKRLGIAHPKQPLHYPPPDAPSDCSSPPQLTVEEALAEIARYDREEAKFEIEKYPGTQDPRYCEGCCGSLPPEPRPEEMSIFLHAIRYETSLGTFESELPEWASEGWKGCQA